MRSDPLGHFFAGSKPDLASFFDVKDQFLQGLGSGESSRKPWMTDQHEVARLLR